MADSSGSGGGGNAHIEAVQKLTSRLTTAKDGVANDLKNARSTENPPQSWASDEKLSGAIGDMGAAAKSVGECATKLVLVLKDPATKADAAASICDEFGHGAEVLATTLAVLESCNPGAPLWVEAVQAVHTFIGGCVDFLGVVSTSLLALADKNAGGKKEKKRSSSKGSGAIRESPDEEEQNMARACGIVWNLAETKFKQLPKSNRVAYRRSIMLCSSLVKETADEFQAMVDSGVKQDDGESGVAEGAPSGGGGGGDLDDFDFFEDGGGDDGEGDCYTSAEMPLAVASVSALKLMRPTLKTALDALDVAAAAAESTPTTTTLREVGTVCALCRRGTDACTELGAALYPALDVDEIEAAVAPLAAVTAELGAVLAFIADAAALRKGTLADDFAEKASIGEQSTKVSPPSPPGTENGEHAALRRVEKVWLSTLAEVDAAAGILKNA